MRMRLWQPVAALVVLMMVPGCTGSANDVNVTDDAGLRSAIANARPGDRILLAPGEYAGGMGFGAVQGAEGSPIVIAGADPAIRRSSSAAARPAARRSGLGRAARPGDDRRHGQRPEHRRWRELRDARA